MSTRIKICDKKIRRNIENCQIFAAYVTEATITKKEEEKKNYYFKKKIYEIYQQIETKQVFFNEIYLFLFVSSFF